MAPGARELESVLQQVRDRRREDLPVHLDRDPLRDGGDGELQAPSLRFDRRRDLDLFDELGEQDRFPSLDPGLEAHLGERAVDEVAHARQVAAEHGARAAADSDASALEDLEGQHGIAEQVPQLVREEPQPLGLVIRDRQLALAPELGNGFGHRLVEAPVERAELVGRDRRVQLDGQLGDGLADVAIVVDDLGRGEPDLLQGLAMLGRAQADLMVGSGVPPLDSSMRNVAMSWSRNRGTPVCSSTGVARGAALEATFALLFAMIVSRCCGQEFGQHESQWCNSRATVRGRYWAETRPASRADLGHQLGGSHRLAEVGLEAGRERPCGGRPPRSTR